MLTPYLPYPLLSGGQIRTYNLLKKMSSKHQITLFALIKDREEEKYVSELEKYCYKVKVFKRSQKPFTIKNIFKTAFSSYPFVVIRNHVPEVMRAIREEVEAEKYDAIHAETFYMMPHIPSEIKLPKILAEQTIEYLGYKSFAKKFGPQKFQKIFKPFLDIDIKKITKWEKYYWKNCDKLITMSEDDKKYIASQIGQKEKIAVVANGVDTKWFADYPNKRPKTPTILSVGTFKWLPNVEAVEFLVTQVWPLVKEKMDDVKLWIVGNSPTQEVRQFAKKDKSVVVTGNLPDIRDAFKGAHVLAAPVFSGKGTRYKILEAMASGTPIVATTTAVEGLDIKNGEQALIANNAKEMAKEIIRLLNDQRLQNKLAKQGASYVAKNFDWDKIADELDQIYLEIKK
jgi:glycosyltransferase involved in cell wall biosynthesis